MHVTAPVLHAVHVLLIMHAAGHALLTIQQVCMMQQGMHGIQHWGCGTYQQLARACLAHMYSPWLKPDLDICMWCACTPLLIMYFVEHAVHA
jgi:hypothetical protein